MIPKGWKVIVWVRYLHTNPENFENPMCFNPDRWNVCKPYICVPLNLIEKMVYMLILQLYNSLIILLPTKLGTSKARSIPSIWWRIKDLCREHACSLTTCHLSSSFGHGIQVRKPTCVTYYS